MRIIGGNLKGKKIFLPRDKKTRPLRDLVKESIFNLIQHSNKINFNIVNSNILDLFSGIGSFGIECISRNSKKVTFVESYKETLSVLKKNILTLKIEKKCKIFEKDCFHFIKKIEIEEKFDLVFLDPPYKEENINLIIDLIKEKKILNKQGILIIHRHKKDKIELSENLTVLDERDYGISKIIIGY